MSKKQFPLKSAKVKSYAVVENLSSTRGMKTIMGAPECFCQCGGADRSAANPMAQYLYWYN